MKNLMKEIDMIAYFKISDLPYPIRFRIKEDKTESLKTISVDDIIQKSKDRKYGNLMYIYDCSSKLEHGPINYRLIYEVELCKWYFYVK